MVLPETPGDAFPTPDGHTGTNAGVLGTVVGEVAVVEFVVAPLDVVVLDEDEEALEHAVSPIVTLTSAAPRPRTRRVVR